ncbi:hypothetical protein Tco_0869865 [Tanacetum coccineum]
MANIRSCNKHNMIACVEKTAQNADFYQVIDFLTGCSINYSLLVDPDLIGPWLQQFWATATLQVINDVPHIRAKVAGKKILISEATIRADLLFDDENGVDCFPKQVIWDTLRDMVPRAIKSKVQFFFVDMNGNARHISMAIPFIMRFIAIALSSHVRLLIDSIYGRSSLSWPAEVLLQYRCVQTSEEMRDF